ncbi:MAG: hypothetical protein AAFZ65_07960, partial [Planctomycetota bacterium]
EERPEWEAARVNRDVARRRIRGEPEVGEATEVGADGVVFDPHPKSGGDTVTVEPEQALSDQSMRALWLRNVQTRPGDFLRAKFAYQQATEGER